MRETVGNRIAVTAKLNMVDGMRGGIWLAESLRTAQLLDRDGNLDAIELTEGSSVYKPLYLFRGDVPADDFAKVLPPLQSIGVRLFGKWAMGSYDYRDLYMLDNARQFTPVVRDTKLILLGGINNRDHMVTGLRAGFDFLALGRALLREPDLVNRLMDDPSVRGRCNHNNKCMVTVFGRTHCVLDPEQRYGAGDRGVAGYAARGSVVTGG